MPREWEAVSGGTGSGAEPGLAAFLRGTSGAGAHPLSRGCGGDALGSLRGAPGPLCCSLREHVRGGAERPPWESGTPRVGLGSASRPVPGQPEGDQEPGCLMEKLRLA